MPGGDDRARIVDIGRMLERDVDPTLRDRIAVALDRGDRIVGPARPPIGPVGPTRPPVGPVGPVGPTRPPVGPVGPGRPDPPPPGTAGPVRFVPVKELTPLVRRVVAGEQRRVVWATKGNEASVLLDSLRVATDDGLVLVGLTLDTDQTGPQELTTVLAVGSDTRPAGLLAVAEERPRGHGDLAATFAEPVIATAWRGVLLVVAAAAAASGQDAFGDPLVPGALAASAKGLTVHTIADHRLGATR